MNWLDLHLAFLRFRVAWAVEQTEHFWWRLATLRFLYDFEGLARAERILINESRWLAVLFVRPNHEHGAGLCLSLLVKEVEVDRSLLLLLEGVHRRLLRLDLESLLSAFQVEVEGQRGDLCFLWLLVELEGRQLSNQFELADMRVVVRALLGIWNLLVA